MVELINYDVLNNSYMIWTDSEQLTKEYAFEKKNNLYLLKILQETKLRQLKL